MHFGATLRLLRFDSGLSLRDLARKLGVSGAYLSRVENGLDAAPTPARLQTIARELGVPAPLLMDLAPRVSPLVADYVAQVPEAGTLFLDIAHRRLSPAQLAEVQQFISERFPAPKRLNAARAPKLSALLSARRVVLDLDCVSMEDALDVAAARISEDSSSSAGVLSQALRAREGEVSSALGGGVAVPCAYVAGSELRAALVTLARPLAYDTPDAKPVRLLVAFSGPRHSSERRRLLAHVARLTGRDLVDELANVDSPARALARLTALEAVC